MKIIWNTTCRIHMFFFISNPNLDRPSLGFSKIRATWSVTAEPQIRNSQQLEPQILSQFLFISALVSNFRAILSLILGTSDSKSRLNRKMELLIKKCVPGIEIYRKQLITDFSLFRIQCLNKTSQPLNIIKCEEHYAKDKQSVYWREHPLPPQ